MQEYYDFENGPTDAFNEFAEDILTQEIDGEKYLGKYNNLNSSIGVVAELELRKLICLYLSDEVNSILPNWEQTKRKYIEACSRIPFDEFQAKFRRYEAKLKTIAKLKYCTDILKSSPENHANAYLDTSNYLMAIYHKLSGMICGQNHTNRSTKFATTEKAKRQEELMNNKVYGYLHDSTLESFSSKVNYRILFNTPIEQLINRLFCFIVITQYEYNHTIIEPWLGIDDKGNIKQQYRHIFAVDDGITSDIEALQYAEQLFNDWLINQMHILDNGKTF